MFHSARLKLTAWYLLIIMLVSLFFSVIIYQGMTSELDRVERMQRIRAEMLFPGRFRIDPEIIADTKNRIKLMLAIIDLTILGGSAIAGYFLAGRTLKPISEMVEEQKQFISDASHEMRTPLTSLKSEIEVSLRDKKLTLNEAQKILKSNLEEVNNLQVLTDNLVRLSQYQKGNKGFTFLPVPFSLVTQEAVKKVSRLAKNKKIKIVNEVKEFLLEGDDSSLTEMLVIFLDNAIKYSPSETEVKIASKKNDGYLVLTVADQGIGISEEDIPHIFDRFYRADMSRNKFDVPGYGLGLAIAKRIIDKHHGSVKVESKLGEGTTFEIKLPLKQHLS